MPLPRPTIYVSACLYGEPVRYDGTDKRLSLLRQELDNKVNWLSICPELLADLGVPRPPVNLVQRSTTLQIIGRDDPSLDVTQRLTDSCLKIQQSLAQQQIYGFILKARSPSCGLGSTPIFSANNQNIGLGHGIMAQIIEANWPATLKLEEKDLNDSRAIALFLSCATLHQLLDWPNAPSHWPQELADIVKDRDCKTAGRVVSEKEALLVAVQQQLFNKVATDDGLGENHDRISQQTLDALIQRWQTELFDD